MLSSIFYLQSSALGITFYVLRRHSAEASPRRRGFEIGSCRASRWRWHMIRSVVRLLGGAVLALAVCGGVWAAPTRDATTWNVLIGGESADHALQAQGFFPTNITIDEGDTI